MSETAAHLLDRVIRPIPVRQWVLTLPFAIRRWAACRPEVIGALNTILVQTVFDWLRARARDLGVVGGEPGAVTFIQRFGDAVRLTPHLHVLVSDGVFSPSASGTGPATFHPVRPPSQGELEALVARIASKAERALAKLDRRGNDAPGFTDRCAAVAVQGALSLDDTRRPRTVRGPKPERRLPRLCAEVDGFNVHAAVRIAARSRRALEHLIRYVARPAIADQRLSLGDDGRVHVALKRVWSDGTRTVSYDPLTFLERVVALIPPPRANLVRNRWTGLLPLLRATAPHWRGLCEPAGAGSTSSGGGAARMAEGCCRRQPTAVEGILAAMSLPVVEPPRARARAPPLRDPYDDTDDPRQAWNDDAA